MNYRSVLSPSKHKLIRGTIGLIGAALLLCMGSANAILVSTLEDATNGGGFFGQVTIEDTAGGVTITATVDDDFIMQNLDLNQADILGLWFDVNDDSILANLSAANIQNASPNITGFEADAGNVGSVGTNNNNLNGTGLLFDIGIALGTQGADDGAFQTVSFDFIGMGISEALFADQNVGMRVQSIDSTVFAGGSSKLTGGTTGGGTPVPTPGSLALLGIGALSFVGFSRRRRKQA